MPGRAERDRFRERARRSETIGNADFELKWVVEIDSVLLSNPVNRLVLNVVTDSVPKRWLAIYQSLSRLA
jgi:hypothetical protein